MSLAIATSPAIKATLGTITLDAFNAPANSLLVLTWAGPWTQFTPTGGDLTWQSRKISTNRYAQIWTAPVPTAKNGLVIVLSGAEFEVMGGAKVWLVTGADNASPVGATGTSTSTANTLNATAYTTTRSGSLCFFAAYENTLNYPSPTLPTTTDVGEAYSLRAVYATNGGGVVGRKATPAAAAGQTVQFNADAAGTASASWEWAAAEILPLVDAGAPAPPTGLRVTQVTGTSFTVAWDAASDPSGIAGYGIYLDGVQVAGP
ncbi:fibronectin type III domain-containing protein [Nonomuraea turkmeniaca]|uniref:Fibronectin type III domain-containing protein n=1 Tax=Nonomuraea turkmeniaca TaxID=103838 RepID=A0A5S4G7Y1_9ACTN|nr:fibronectin type III domain-containing protein [Nonomuraea turkmeniaca]TMR22060.1 fibronectin type III domain-containing protein [Nonomuraea turkmeniaca]